jgi:hypothetical protein
MFVITAVIPQILHGVISQKIELFITTAVRTSVPSQMGCCQLYKEEVCNFSFQQKAA